MIPAKSIIMSKVVFNSELAPHLAWVICLQRETNEFPIRATSIDLRAYKWFILGYFLPFFRPWI
jgi:hypothetical protein